MQLSLIKLRQCSLCYSSLTISFQVKKSIFASPEGTGKVGVGTCGIADKQMTKYEHGAKYNARHLIPR